MPYLSRLATALVVTGLLLAGCADKPATRTSSSASPTSSAHPSSSTPSSTSTTQNKNRQDDAASAAAAQVVREDDAETTGIAACDDYLSSYIACHKAANIFAPGQLPERYEAMRNSLLRDSRNPEIRPQLAARCNSLATQLRQALHGKPCASAATQP